MNLTRKQPSILSSLRDQVALEADWHMSHAKALDRIAADFAALGDARRGKEITVAADNSRRRATILREVVALAAQPEAAAS